MGADCYDNYGSLIYKKSTSVNKLDYFFYKNVNIKKIVCGGGMGDFFNIFLTGY
jgi:hypothetical protein